VQPDAEVFAIATQSLLITCRIPGSLLPLTQQPPFILNPACLHFQSACLPIEDDGGDSQNVVRADALFR